MYSLERLELNFVSMETFVVREAAAKYDPHHT